MYVGINFFYDLLDEDNKKLARETAAEYPFTVEYVSKIIAAKGYNSKEQLREYLNRELVRYTTGRI